jgi:hypothetical protein
MMFGMVEKVRARWETGSWVRSSTRRMCRDVKYAGYGKEPSRKRATTGAGLFGLRFSEKSSNTCKANNIRILLQTQSLEM